MWCICVSCIRTNPLLRHMTHIRIYYCIYYSNAGNNYSLSVSFGYLCHITSISVTILDLSILFSVFLLNCFFFLLLFVNLVVVVIWMRLRQDRSKTLVRACRFESVYCEWYAHRTNNLLICRNGGGSFPIAAAMVTCKVWSASTFLGSVAHPHQRHRRVMPIWLVRSIWNQIFVGELPSSIISPYA